MTIRMIGFRRDSGFSLIEVLIAVVILATGLLALTALQGRLAQASGDAKVRSRVASLLTSRMDELRAAQYASIPPAAGSASATVTSTCAGGAAWVCSAETESKASGLSVAHTYARFMDVAGAFTSSGAAAPNLSTAEFKRITLTATWTDASGAGRSLAVSTDVSPLSLTGNRIPTAPGGAGSGGNAIVRQDSPATDGVIPLTVGDSATAASNPRPEILEGQGNSREIVGTRFDVLTYQGNSGEAVIQRRVETSVIKCNCAYGAGGATNLGTIYADPQWPAIWDGNKYRLVKEANGDAPGVTANAGPTNDDQSALCTECCRDHHDSSAIAVNESFDPERRANGSAGFSKYNAAGNPVGSGEYVNACRLVRVDGFWRTASDMYSRHFALLPTKAKAPSTDPATSGVPKGVGDDVNAVGLYETFVKDYLGGVDGTAATPPSNAASLFAGSPYASIAKTSPEAISLDAAPDVRFLHARGLYIDYLGTDAQATLVKVLANKARYCPEASSNAECVLLYLPLSTINLTEIANWAARTSETPSSAASDVIIVSNDRAGTQIWDPVEPTRSSTQVDSGEDGDQAFAVSTIGQSNAGVAVAAEVDPYDGTLLSDAQKFGIGDTVTDSGHNFWIEASGVTADGYGVSWTVPCTGTRTGIKKCTGLADGNATVVDLNFGSYNFAGTKIQNATNPCSSNGNPKVDKPRYNDHTLGTTYQVCSVTTAGVEVPNSCSTGTISPEAEVDSQKKTESTRVANFTVQENKVYKFAFTSELKTAALVACDAEVPQWEDLGYGW